MYIYTHSRPDTSPLTLASYAFVTYGRYSKVATSSNITHSHLNRDLHHSTRICALPFPVVSKLATTLESATRLRNAARKSHCQRPPTANAQLSSLASHSENRHVVCKHPYSMGLYKPVRRNNRATAKRSPRGTRASRRSKPFLGLAIHE